MIDAIILKTLLNILIQQKALVCGAEENQLFDLINLDGHCGTVTTNLLREHIQLAEDKGWADWRLDSIKQKRWRITPAGEQQFSNLMRGQ